MADTSIWIAGARAILDTGLTRNSDRNGTCSVARATASRIAMTKLCIGIVATAARQGQRPTDIDRDRTGMVSVGI